MADTLLVVNEPRNEKAGDRFVGDSIEERDFARTLLLDDKEHLDVASPLEGA